MADNKKVFCGKVTGTSAPVTRKTTLIMNKKALRPIERGDCGSLTTALGIAVGEFGYAIDPAGTPQSEHPHKRKNIFKRHHGAFFVLEIFRELHTETRISKLSSIGH